jgi:hypothetical protein
MVNAELREIAIAWSAASGFVEFDRHRAVDKLANKLPLAFNLDEANDRCIARVAVRNPADRLCSLQLRLTIRLLHYSYREV